MANIAFAEPEFNIVQISEIGNLYYGFCPGCFLSVPFSAEEDAEIFQDDDLKRTLPNKLAELELIPFKSKTRSNKNLQIGLVKEQVEAVWPDLIMVAKDYNDKPRFAINHQKLAVAEIEMLLTHNEILRDQQMQIMLLQQEVEELRKHNNK